MKGILGRNLGMSQKFDENGDLVPVSVIECGPCTVTQKKTNEKEGYAALQLGFDEVKKVQRVPKARKGHFQKAGTPVFRHLAECRVNNIDDVNVGDTVGADAFNIGEYLNVRGQVKGRGFQGVIKRHGKSGGGAAHGSHFHRAPGSIGQNSSPSKVIKGMRLPGHMGTNFVTAKNLKLVDVDLENSLIFVKGCIPGHKNGIVIVSPVELSIADRMKKLAETKAQASAKKSEAPAATEVAAAENS